MGESPDRSAGLQAGCLLAVIFLCIAVVGAGAVMSIVENRKNKELPGAKELTAKVNDFVNIAGNGQGTASAESSSAPVGKVVPIDVTDETAKLDYDIWKALPDANHPASAREVQAIALISYFKKEFPKYYDAGESGYAYACNVKLVDMEGNLIRRGEVAGQPPSIAPEGSKNAGPLNDVDVVAFILGR